MTRHLPATLLIAASLALGGCATAVPPVEVTRFHGNAPAGWAPGTRYAVDEAPLGDPAAMVGANAPSLEWSSYRTAVEQQLQRQGLVAGVHGGFGRVGPAVQRARLPELPSQGWARAHAWWGRGRRRLYVPEALGPAT